MPPISEPWPTNRQPTTPTARAPVAGERLRAATTRRVPAISRERRAARLPELRLRASSTRSTGRRPSARSWSVDLRCPDCEWHGSGVYAQEVVDRFDEALDRGTEQLLGDLQPAHPVEHGGAGRALRHRPAAPAGSSPRTSRPSPAGSIRGSAAILASTDRADLHRAARRARPRGTKCSSARGRCRSCRSRRQPRPRDRGAAGSAAIARGDAAARDRGEDQSTRSSTSCANAGPAVRRCSRASRSGSPSGW